MASACSCTLPNHPGTAPGLAAEAHSTPAVGIKPTQLRMSVLQPNTSATRRAATWRRVPSSTWDPRVPCHRPAALIPPYTAPGNVARTAITQHGARDRHAVPWKLGDCGASLATTRIGASPDTSKQGWTVLCYAVIGTAAAGDTCFLGVHKLLPCTLQLVSLCWQRVTRLPQQGPLLCSWSTSTIESPA